MNETHTLKGDAAGFLISDKPVNPDRSELSILRRLREDLKAFRGMFEAKKHPSDEPGSDAPSGAGNATVTPATPRLSGATGAQTKPLAIPEPGKIATPGGDRTIVVNVTQPVATPKRITPEGTVVDRALPKLDPNGRPIAPPEPAKPVLNKPVVIKVDQTMAGAADGTGRPDGKIRDLLGDIKDKIGGVDLSGGEEVDPNIKAAQEIAGVAGSAFNGIKAVGGALGTIATPMISGVMGMAKPKPTDAPTPWFKRFYNELRGLRREESVFNRAQLRTLKEIEAKPGEGKGGGIMGFLMMLMGPLMAAIGAAITAGFGLLMKLPGMGMLAKLATALMPAALMPKRPITQPTTVPVGVAGQPPGAAQKKPSMWERTKSKVSGWMGVSDPTSTVPGGSAAGAAGTVTESAAKKPGLLARAGKGIGGMLKRVPVLGALLGAVSIGTGVYASESDEGTTRAEKDKNTGKAIGGGGGAIAGMAAGGAAGAKLGALVGMIGGPVGSAIGIAIGGLVGGVAGSFFGEKAGAILGETVGGWVTELRNADIPGAISRAWASTTSAMAKGWESSLSMFGGIWGKAKGVFDDLSLGATKLLSKFGIDLPAVKQKATEALEAGKQNAKDAAAAVGGTVAAGKDKVVQGATAAVDYGKEKAGQAGEALKNSAMGRGASAIAGVIESVGKTRVLQREDGSIETRKDGTAAWRNNNPGNMEYGPYAKSQGAVGSDGRFAVFPTLEAGAKAKEKLIFEGKNYKDLPLQDAIARYAPAKEKANNTPMYQKAVLDAVGGQNKRMADYTPEERKAILKAMGRVEGFEVGTVSVTGGPSQAATNAAPTIAGSPAANTVVTAGARTIPKMQALTVEPPKVPDFQPVTAGLAATMAGGKEQQRPSVIVVGNKTPVGRDLSNRTLAHIVTGGLSGA
jgi:hypothetical protein